MSPPWSRPLDVDRLADGGADVDFAVPLAELSGLRSRSGSVAGEVHGRAHFTRQQGVAVVELTLNGAATLECQRCLQPMGLPVDTVVRVGLVGTEADVARVPAELEPMLASGGRVSIGELVTEELLLTLPIVPLHAGRAPCVAAPAAGERASETYKPFARLGELLKR
ncbi:MAG: YceD family protein [Steroidobacteraceae bacterium]